MPFKKVRDRQEYQKLWKRRKRKGEITRLTPIYSEEQRKVMRKKWDKTYRDNRKLEYLKLMKKHLTIKCVVCKYDERLICHRKDGKKHKLFSVMNLNDVETELKTGKYIRVCFKCHKHIHWCMIYLKMSWDDINLGF